MTRRSIIIVLITLLAASAGYCALSYNGTSESVAKENAPLMTEMYRIIIHNVVNGEIEASRDKGGTWQTLGKVLAPAAKVNDEGYTASKWVDDGDIAAVAVNAIHVKTDYNEKEEKGIIFNISPKEYFNKLAVTSPEATIFTDIKAGEGIFGGGFSPFVGSRVQVLGPGNQFGDIQTGYSPSIGDVMLIRVERPTKYPKEIVFENRFGGLISIKYLDGETRYIGQVLRPVEGVGRFIGSEYADVGRIRANHAGVICISTSPLVNCELGGFQIIPSGHGMSQEMITARTLTQWMVIGPISALDPSFEGVAPFFKYFLQPRYSEDDIDKPDWQQRMLERFLVEVKYKGSDEWKPMPAFSMDLNKPLPKWANTAMEGVTHIRILFPIYKDEI